MSGTESGFRKLVVIEFHLDALIGDVCVIGLQRARPRLVRQLVDLNLGEIGRLEFGHVLGIGHAFPH
jgi:hypothetical protein